jgi:hypothetical protein
MLLFLLFGLFLLRTPARVVFMVVERAAAQHANASAYARNAAILPLLLPNPGTTFLC